MKARCQALLCLTTMLMHGLFGCAWHHLGDCYTGHASHHELAHVAEVTVGHTHAGSCPASAAHVHSAELPPESPATPVPARCPHEETCHFVSSEPTLRSSDLGCSAGWLPRPLLADPADAGALAHLRPVVPRTGSLPPPAVVAVRAWLQQWVV